MRLLTKILIDAALVCGAAYGADDLYARYRHDAFADVHIDRVLAVVEKYNKVDYERTDPITERCVYALMPHFGYNPCWYVTRHTLRFIKVGGVYRDPGFPAWQAVKIAVL